MHDLTCVTLTTCYVPSAFNDPQHDTPLFAVLVTHDGGTTWTVHGIDAVFRAGSTSSNTRVQLGRISCPSVTTCFAIATAVHMGATPGNQTNVESLMVLSTTDGGETWTAHSPAPAWPVGNSGDPPPLACPTVTTCYVVQYNGYSTPPGSPAVVLVTHDAGATWHSAELSAVAVLYDIACETAQACRAVGLCSSFPCSSGIFGTTDGGMTWRRQLSADGEPLPDLEGVACPAIAICYAVGGLTIVATQATRATPLVTLGREGVLAARPLSFEGDRWGDRRG
jgi:photosystem II stability/assembly factor-like uncharacterized protein